MPQSGDQKPFLGVSESATGQIWQERLDGRARNIALEMAQTRDIPELVARVLAGRGVQNEEVDTFLNPSIRELMPDPDTITGMKTAADHICAAIRKGERVAIFGDYDVDGAASAALLYKFLSQHGLEAEIYIPDRIFEGYGPNPAAISELADKGATLIITVDCGSTSFDALEEARRLGVDVVVLDHHQLGEELPTAIEIVNPNRQDDLSGLGYLCAAGVVFMTLVACVRILRESGWYRDNGPPDLLQMLDLVALATICDVVPLKELNRAFVLKGLAVMRQMGNTGLSALAQISRMSGPPSTYHLGFLLGPRINAGGRIGDAGLGARLLTSDDPVDSREIAEKLEALNQERQAQEAAMLEEAISEAESEIGDGSGPASIVVANDNWHPGIVGLIASRMKDRFHRPVFAVHFDAAGNGTGSGRSIASVDLGGAVRAALEKGILVKGGGHAMAAGITIERDQLGAFRAFLEERLAETVENAIAQKSLKLDGALTARSATLDLYDLLEKAGPYGPGHPVPIFAFPSHEVRYAKIVGRDHVALTLSAGDGATLRAIAFRAADTPLGQLLLSSQSRMHVAGQLTADFWQGTRRIQLRIIDAAIPPKFV
ncbi:MAG: single-stranded-DNA-specific exonuclease RecJ [Rhizobiaceae bacterium]